MFKVSITKNGIQTHGAQIDTLIEAQSWVDECVAYNCWGLPERPELNELGEPTGNILPAEYTIEITDITAQVEEETLKAKSKLAINLGGDILAEIRHLNVSKNLSQLAFLALIDDLELAKIERLLWLGSFETAKAYVNVYSGSSYTAEEKTYILSMIDSAILKLV
jgi:hypothetical protein